MIDLTNLFNKNVEGPVVAIYKLARKISPKVSEVTHTVDPVTKYAALWVLLQAGRLYLVKTMMENESLTKEQAHAHIDTLEKTMQSTIPAEYQR